MKQQINLDGTWVDLVPVERRHLGIGLISCVDIECEGVYAVDCSTCKMQKPRYLLEKELNIRTVETVEEGE